MASKTKPQKAKQPKKTTKAQVHRYLREVGWFVTMFSAVENCVHETLWHFAKVDPIIARCIFSGIRIDAAIGQLKRIGEATEWPKGHKDLFDHVAQQLGEITQLRNDLLHYGVTGETPDTLVVTNEKYAHIKSRIRSTKISVAILEQATKDIFIILLKFGLLDGRLKWPIKRHRHVIHDAFRQIAWHYKPERQGHQAQRLSPKRERQHRLSPK
jgi:hypothetical protein